jgi:hypothetical protein
MEKDDLKNFALGGMDTNSAPEAVDKNDVISAFNTRNSGTSIGEAGKVTNIESTELVPEIVSVPGGIKKTIGGREFDDIQQAITFRYNSFGYHQILVYDYATNTHKAIYTDKTDSAGISLMPLDPQFYVDNVLLVNQSYLVWTDGQSSIGFTNLQKLSTGSYVTILAEDFSLIKPQPLSPPIGSYSNDGGKASNFLKTKLFQFNAMWFGQDYTSSVWSTWSKRIIPSQESTPTTGGDVSQNNCIIISVPVGSVRVQTINIGARYGVFGYNIIKSVDRSYAIALTNTTISIVTEVLEAYDPATGLYSFVFYNDSVATPVAPTETDLAFDYVPQMAGAAEILNGNIIALGDVVEGYARPATDVSVVAVGYDPNLTVPYPPMSSPLVKTEFYAGASGSGAGNHRRRMYVGYRGTPAVGDFLSITLADIRNANATLTYTYTVLAGQSLSDVVNSFAAVIPNSNVQTNIDGSIYINFVGDPYYGGQNAFVRNNVAGPAVSKSIHSVLDNSSYQLALSYRDKYGRYFPLVANNKFIVKTPSFAQTQGLALQLNWNINTPTSPTNAVDYQWLITKNNTTATILDVLGSIINYKGTWSAHANSPTLAPNSGIVGDAYLITVPNLPTDTPINLGNGAISYPTGSYLVYNGQSWDLVDGKFADMTSASNVWVFKLNPLNLFNTEFSDKGISTVLTYDYSQNDRCTLHCYYTSPTTRVWLNNPCIDLTILGYDPATFLLKVAKPSTLLIATILNKDVYMRLSSPKQQVQGATGSENETIWYEIGERFTITNGVHDILAGSITDGDVYFKTRQYRGSIDPSVAYPYLATDFNFSDFYASAFTSYGRPRAYLDVLEAAEHKAVIRYSQNFVLGSRNNGLTRFFAEAIYGEADGQTSSSWGAIGVLWQRGDVLVIIQETNTGYAPINISILEDAAQQKQYAISEKLINNIRYNQTGNIGIGRAKESFCFYDSAGWFIDPNRSAPIQVGLDGLTDIGYKMSKYFKEVIQQAYRNGKKLVMYYDRYYKEVVFATQTTGDILTEFKFTALSWNILNGYTPLPSAITPSNGTHSTVSYNTTTGDAVYTPTTGYVGADVALFSFMAGGATITVNNCLNWTAGNPNVFSFSFPALFGQPLSSQALSNTILVGGNTISAPISIVGGTYSINGGPFISVDGSVNNGDIVQISVGTSGTSSTETHADLTISAETERFSATTGTIVVDAFAFIAQTGLPLTSATTSNTITVSGNTLPSPIGITGGTYSVNGGTYTSVSGTVNAGDMVSVRVTTSGSNNTLASTTLTIDGKTGVFNATTYYVNSFAFTPATGQPVSTTIISNTDTLSGVSNSSLPIAVTGGQYSINGGGYTSSAGTINIGDTFTVQGTSSSAYNTATTVSLTIAYQTSTFSITTQASLPPDATGILVVDIYDDDTLNVIGYVNTAATTPYQVPAYAGTNFVPNTGTISTAYDCWVLSSDEHIGGGSALRRRFEFNIAKLLTNYPAATTFQFIISGRNTAGGNINGQYNLKGAAAGVMIMGGSPGGYVPSTSSTVNIGTVVYSGKPVVSGANGTYGIGIGAVILTFTYDVVAKTMTLTP